MTEGIGDPDMVGVSTAEVQNLAGLRDCWQKTAYARYATAREGSLLKSSEEKKRSRRLQLIETATSC